MRVIHTHEALWLRYECVADRISASMTRYKDKVWTEGAVEAYIEPPGADFLYEFQVSPLGTRRDLRVDSPGTPEQRYVDDWSCPGFTASTRTRTSDDGSILGWAALVRIPWSSMARTDPKSGRWMLGLFRWEHHPVEFSGLKSQPGVDPHDRSFLARLELT